MLRDFKKFTLSKKFWILLIIFFIGCQGPRIKEPTKREIIHGIKIEDPYRWLEDGNSRRTQQWIKKQNELTQATISSLPDRELIRQRITDKLTGYDQIWWPYECNGRYFFYKKLAKQDQFSIYMRKGLKGEDEVLINPNNMSSDHTTSVEIWDISKDGSLIAYGLRRGGEDASTIKLYDVDGRKDLPDHLEKGYYYSNVISLKPDNSGFYYKRRRNKGDRIYYHDIGTKPSGDIELFGNNCGPDTTIGVNLSEDGRYLLINVGHGTVTTETKIEIYYQNVAEKGPILPVVNGVDARFEGKIANNYLFLKTNWNAPNGRILRVDLTNPARENWQEIIPECDAVLERFYLAGGKLLVTYMRNVCSQLKIFEPDGTYVRDIALPEMYNHWASCRWETTEAFLTSSSFHIPTVTYRYDTEKDTKEVWWQDEFPIDSNIFEVKQIWYESKDGTKIPMFIVHTKELKLDGQNPTLLKGYGGFNNIQTPSFSFEAALWIEFGGVYAQPNLRGGGEFGEKWHEAGVLENKQKVFDDFIAAAEWLIAEGYTSQAKLAISGASNGGLLVGAALTQRPDLFRAVVCEYPLLDMLRYHKFFSARYYASEYGTAKDREQFKYLYAYSPYHNVVQGTKYPAVLFVTGDSDTQVPPLHANKMAALLQSTTSADRPVLLQNRIKEGHSGLNRPMSKYIEDMTDMFSFLFWQLGVNFSEPNPSFALFPGRVQIFPFHK